MVPLFFITAIVFLILGVPIAGTIGAASILYIALSGMQMMIVIQKLFAGVNSVALLAIPFFVLAGDLMNSGGIAKRLVRMANKRLGKYTGGLATVTIIGCMFFAAISGSGVATAAALGSIMIPAMVNNGYDRAFAASVVASASPIGVIIPPSISFVLYGVLTGTSITDLYLAGIPAGVLMGLCLIAVSYAVSRKNGYKTIVIAETIEEDPPAFVVSPDDNSALANAKRTWNKISDSSFWAIGTPLILIGGVFGGIFTPTESAVVGVVYAIIVGIYMYRDMKWKDIPKVFLSSGKTAAKIMFIIANASLFAYVLTYERIPQAIVDGLIGITDNRIILLLIINGMLLIAGTFMETSAILIIMVPLLLPVIEKIGMDLTHFGIVITVNTAIGLLTPPFGVCLFTSANVGKVSVEALSKRVLLFIGAMLVALLITTFVPQSVMFLVNASK